MLPRAREQLENPRNQASHGGGAPALGLALQGRHGQRPDAPLHFDVLFEDPHLLAVNKPSGLPTLPGGGFLEHTLLRLVQKRCPTANPVHRLGRATSGIVLFAKASEAAAKLTARWNTPGIQKIYGRGKI